MSVISEKKVVLSTLSALSRQRTKDYKYMYKAMPLYCFLCLINKGSSTEAWLCTCICSQENVKSSIHTHARTHTHTHTHTHTYTHTRTHAHIQYGFYYRTRVPKFWRDLAYHYLVAARYVVDTCTLLENLLYSTNDLEFQIQGRWVYNL